MLGRTPHLPSTPASPTRANPCVSGADLEPYHITRLQIVSRKLQKFCLDDELWKRHCFQSSAWYKLLKARRNLHASIESGNGALDAALPLDSDDMDSEQAVREVDGVTLLGRQQKRWQEAQDMANWDPVFPSEQVSWYDEYIQRKGPACVSWLQTPRLQDRGMEAIIEARGMALYTPHDEHDGIGTMLAVSPLDDGSVCLWDVRGTRGKQGGIVARSKPDILFIDGPGGQNTKRSKKIDTGVTECVSVDNYRHRAFFAVQSRKSLCLGQKRCGMLTDESLDLIEVDLNRLDVVSRESFEWSITTLSPVHEGVPLTVGTSLGIHLHDFRARSQVTRDTTEQLDGTPQWGGTDVFKSIFDPAPLPPYASLAQPTPISILHLPRPGSYDLVSDDIYVSGRFSNILHYDRRKFPAIVGSIYSGALIKSLTALPFPFSTVGNEVRRQGGLTAEQVTSLKTTGDGRTLIAGGGYKTKGSLEIYGLSSAADSTGHEMLQNSAMKNRQTAASSTILSVTNHGTKIVFSDGSGFLKWFERDGTTECRRHRIGHCEADDGPSLFASMEARGELARKIVSTQSKRGNDRPNNDNILFWTGERLGMVSFTTAPLCDPKDFEPVDPEAKAEDGERRLYAGQMRQALDRQADEVRFMNDLGQEGMQE